ncbi:probable pre-mRNA-splicing factor ATP-dependent RNA helicase DEAH4 [Selaginella moellendorffii]|nr:probable pre-mRNA-splicing factor ATP-dependent RNA helicase DEAH4 [Selaginella moellendorffii]XP_024541017.1 probable pre-mRNA-splicing factor ATP-dependent RNA helicase DEAH4 [Selaginella moellendorffii]|eukprot:XP_002962098.2 probable pre-mRNA-splicing factor ATP-dependent RNA helicase DEAH4 [Selaginella moellendorffii]
MSRVLGEGAMAELPIRRESECIVSAVRDNSVTVVIGETGSGKTTQLSQILHDAGFTADGKCIAITQPRRVAAVSVARRVAHEMGVTLGEEVGYAIRFENRTSSRTFIKYLTDGCLLREFLVDIELSQYSVVILDEAHERTLNTDILLGLLKRLVALRKPELKLIVTSATLDGHKISKFFGGCPVVNIPGKLFPVEIMYSTEQPVSYVESAVETAIEIHAKEPPGDILVFMTGQEEIEKVIAKLEHRVQTLEEGSCMDALVLPLHASLPPEFQARVFTPAPSNCRRIIVATNVAETSLTVDGVVYVIDPGFVKQRQYNPTTGMDALCVVQISRVQATQRAGRAGRTCPGKCYRLYSSSNFEQDFPAVTVPEIQRSSLAGALLHLKSLEIPNLDVLNFEYLDAPSVASLEDALRQLYLIDAITSKGDVTSLGKRMAGLPLEPSLARALIAAEDLGCLEDALVLAAMLSCDSVFYQAPKKEKKEQSAVHQDLPTGDGFGDHIQLLQIYEKWRRVDYDFEWCKEHGLQIRAMKFARDIRKQLSLIMQGKSDFRKRKDPAYKNLRKAFAEGFANRLAHRLPNHNGYRTLAQSSHLVQVHPSACKMEIDADGLLPEWILYHELLTTTRPYIKKICVIEGRWAQPTLVKLQDLDVISLSGRLPEESRTHLDESSETKPASAVTQPANKEAVDAARERYMARKKARTNPARLSAR